jgi:hypothetical protein
LCERGVDESEVADLVGDGDGSDRGTCRLPDEIAAGAEQELAVVLD